MRGVALLAVFAWSLTAVFGMQVPPLPFLTTPPVVVADRAHSADSFVESIGFNVHLTYSDTAYANVARMSALLRRLHVHHLRDGVTPGRTDICQIDRSLAAAGLRFVYITQAHPTGAELRAWAACVGPALEGFEGINEYDISHPASDVNWVGTVRSSQRELYTDVKGSPQLASLPVIGPSLTTEAAFRAVGDLSADLDAGNMHDYFSFHEPETSGWGFGGFGSLAYNVAAARAVDPSKPIEATETGYGTDRAGHTVDAATQAAYLPRLLLEQFAAGVPRTYVYELLDDGAVPFGSYGIVDATLTPKPAFVALSSLIGALYDPSTKVASGTLRYTMSGASSDVRHVLLRKGNGDYVVAVWIPAASCNPLTHAAGAPATEDVAFTFASRLRSAQWYRYGSDWQLHAARLPVGGALHVQISDRVTLLVLKEANV